MYGKKRSFKMTRLLEPATVGSTTIKIESENVDLVAGDLIGLAATDFVYNTGEKNTVVSFDSGTGVLTLETPLKNYHWGAAVSTAEKYNGVDMRGEVVSLSRNIKIIGERIDDWGCQILTSDIMEMDGSFREGKTSMDSVEVNYGG